MLSFGSRYTSAPPGCPLVSAGPIRLRLLGSSWLGAGLFWLSFAAVLGADYASKHWAVCRVPLAGYAAEGIPVIPGLLHWLRVHNTGAAWSLWQGQAQALAYFSLAVGLALYVAHRCWAQGCVYRQLTLGTLLGGTLGNAIDRFAWGYVVDFIDLQAFGWHFPAFNVADAAISVGLLGLFILIGQPRPIRAHTAS